MTNIRAERKERLAFIKHAAKRLSNEDMLKILKRQGFRSTKNRRTQYALYVQLEKKLADAPTFSLAYRVNFRTGKSEVMIFTNATDNPSDEEKFSSIDGPSSGEANHERTLEALKLADNFLPKLERAKDNEHERDTIIRQLKNVFKH